MNALHYALSKYSPFKKNEKDKLKQKIKLNKTLGLHLVFKNQSVLKTYR